MNSHAGTSNLKGKRTS